MSVTQVSFTVSPPGWCAAGMNAVSSSDQNRVLSADKTSCDLCPSGPEQWAEAQSKQIRHGRHTHLSVLHWKHSSWRQSPRSTPSELQLLCSRKKKRFNFWSAQGSHNGLNSSGPNMLFFFFFSLGTFSEKLSFISAPFMSYSAWIKQPLIQDDYRLVTVQKRFHYSVTTQYQHALTGLELVMLCLQWILFTHSRETFITSATEDNKQWVALCRT